MVLSWVAVLLEILGAAIFIVEGSKYTGLETLGAMIVGLAGFVLIFGASIAGLVIAAIGLKRSRDRHVRALPLNIAFVIHLAVFWGVTLKFACGR